MTLATSQSSRESTSLVDLLRSGRYATDKSEDYLKVYQELSQELREGEICLLELGVRDGGSLRLWHDYFPRGAIAGLGLKLPKPAPAETARIRMFKAAQDDEAMLGRIRREVAPGGFDIVIDDCSHLGRPSSRSFQILFSKHLKPGGIYGIEDWGTGYWSWWPDGSSSAPARPSPFASLTASLPLVRYGVERSVRVSQMSSHQSGMVGFVKQLIDDCARPDREKKSASAPNGPPSMIEEITIRPGLVIVRKRRNG